MRFIFCTYIEMFPINKKNKKGKVNKNILHFQISSKPNVDILGIAVSMWGKHEFETILISNDVMNIQDGIGKGFGSR